MHFFFALAVFGLVAVMGYNVYVFHHTSGTIAQRVAAAWKGSMTIFTAIFATIVSYITTGLDGLANLTGEPEFRTIADSMTKVMTPQVQQIVATLLPASLAALVIWSRTRTLPKS